MSFFLDGYLSSKKSTIKPLHVGFGFGGNEIQQMLKKNVFAEKETTTKVTAVKAISLNAETSASLPEYGELGLEKFPKILESNEIAAKVPFKNISDFDEEAKKIQNHDFLHSNYYVNPFLAFLAWTIDALLGFCFLIISLCINYVFIPKGFLDISPVLASYLSKLTLDMNVIYTFLFSLQVWLVMAILVFLFQYTILGFEGATLGRWLFGISIQNEKNKSLKASEKTKICAAISESLLLGGMLSFLFIVIFPSRVPIFFWMRYSSKKQ